MKLSDQMKPEDLQKVKDYYIKHNFLSTLTVIEQELQKSYKTEIKLHVASDIFEQIYPMELFDLSKFYDLFKNEKKNN